MNARAFLIAGIIASVAPSITMSCRGSSAVLTTSYWSPADFNPEFGPGLKLEGSLNELFDIEFRAASFPDMGKDMRTEDGPVLVDLAVMPLELGLTMNFPYIPDPWIQSYFGGGIGYHQIDLSARGPAGNINYDVDNELGAYAVIGSRLFFNPYLILMLEVNQRFVEGKAVQTAEDGARSTIDMNLNGLGGTFGLGFFW